MINTKIEIVFESGLDKRAAVMRQLSVLYGTRKGEQALDRGFGLDWSCLDQPLELAKAMLSAEIIAQTAKYIPSIFVSSIDFAADAQGNMTPTVHLEEADNE